MVVYTLFSPALWENLILVDVSEFIYFFSCPGGCWGRARSPRRRGRVSLLLEDRGGKAFCEVAGVGEGRLGAEKVVCREVGGGL